MIDRHTANLRSLREQAAGGKYTPQLIERRLPERPASRVARPQQQSADLRMVSDAVDGMSGFGLFIHDGCVYVHGINEGERFAIKVEAPVLIWGRDYLRLVGDTIKEHDRSNMSLYTIVGGLQAAAASGSAPSDEEPKQEEPPVPDEAEPAFLADAPTAHEERAVEVMAPLPGAGSQQEPPEVVMPSRESGRADSRVIDDMVLSREPVKAGYVGSLEERPHYDPDGPSSEFEKVEGWEN